MFRYIVTLLMLGSVSLAAAQETRDALALMNEVHKNYYYADDGGKARVGMVLTDKKGRTREREFWMFRTDVEDMGDQRYYTYFTKPADVRGTGFLVHKHADGDDSRWLYVPSVDLVKRIAADDRRSSFVGSDFTYEDVSGRIPSLDNHTMLAPEVLGDKEMLVVKSVPVDPGTADYSWRKTWIDPEFRLPVQEEYYDDKEEVVRRFIVDKVEIIDDHATATQRTMVDIKSEHQTTISFTEVTYGVDLEADDYTERLLKNPPRSLR